MFNPSLRPTTLRSSGLAFGIKIPDTSPINADLADSAKRPTALEQLKKRPGLLLIPDAMCKSPLETVLGLYIDGQDPNGAFLDKVLPLVKQFKPKRLMATLKQLRGMLYEPDTQLTEKRHEHREQLKAAQAFDPLVLLQPVPDASPSPPIVLDHSKIMAAGNRQKSPFQSPGISDSRPATPMQESHFPISDAEITKWFPFLAKPSQAAPEPKNGLIGAEPPKLVMPPKPPALRLTLDPMDIVLFEQQVRDKHRLDEEIKAIDTPRARLWRLVGFFQELVHPTDPKRKLKNPLQIAVEKGHSIKGKTAVTEISQAL